MASIRQTFFEECDEQLVELENGLLAIQAGADDSETINAVFRAVHSIKGGAGAFELSDLVRFAHVFENTLDALRTGRITAHSALVKTMLQATDFLTDLVAASRDGVTLDPSRSASLSSDLAGLLPGSQAVWSSTSATPVTDQDDGGDDFTFVPVMIDLSSFDDLLALPGVSAPSGHRVSFKPRPEFYAKGSETTLLFRELTALGTLEVVCDHSELPLLDALDPEGAYLVWTVDVQGSDSLASVQEIFDFVEWDSDVAIESLPGALAAGEPAAFVDDAVVEHQVLAASRPAATLESSEVAETAGTAAESGSDRIVPPSVVARKEAAQHATIRVDLDRVDRLINLAGELVINQAMLNERVSEVGMSRRSGVANGLEELEQLTRAIQDSVMAIRAQPVRAVFQRLPRLVRELANQTGKVVRLVTEGEDTEVDKIVIEHLGDPLTHMIRNAIDHGLESTETRLATGKAAEGCVRVAAMHRSGRIVIEVSDDGAGINRTRVRQIAIDKGLVAVDAVLSDDEIDNLIFLPGFSTAAAVSDISGRGVGMDVVRREIQALGGRISIASRPGEGSTFTLSLPLTLAVLDGMALTVAEQTFLVPLSAVVEILMPQDLAVHGFNADARVIGLRDTFVPLFDAGHRLGIRSQPIEPREGIVLLLETDAGERIGLVVDAIQGQRQVVIKSLEANYGAVQGIAAATILGDGRVALILDVDAMMTGGQPVRSERPSPRYESPMSSTLKPTDPRELVTFLIGSHEFCVNIMAVREIRGWTPATPLPHTPDYVRGVINLRGAVLSIIDLATRLGLPAQEPTARHVIIVVQIGDQLAGLLVDAVTGILSVEGKTVLPPPASAAVSEMSAIAGVLAIDDRMISLVELATVLPVEERVAA